MIRLIASIAIVLMFAACARAAAVASGDATHYGSLSLAPDWLRRWNLVPSARLPETPVLTVSATIRRAADSLALASTFDPGCTRYFVASEGTVAVLRTSCGPEFVTGTVARADGNGIAHISRGGRIATDRLSWGDASVHIKLVPAERDRLPGSAPRFPLAAAETLNIKLRPRPDSLFTP